MFKSLEAHKLFSGYLHRISRWAPCDASGRGLKNNRPGTTTWICDRASDARVMSSEELSGRVEKLRDSGTREFHIVIGGPDGFPKKELEFWNPDLKWGFGPLTFPHELAAVIAGEQIYRAFTILNRMPYHLGH